MLHSKRKLTKDKVIDVFYPDTAIESADNIFHQIISKFRSLIKIPDAAETKPGNGKPAAGPSAVKKKKGENEIPLISPFIVYEDKTLEINENYMYYIESNEFESLTRKASAERDPQKKLHLLKKAADMYKGDFLEGNYETWVEELKTRYKSAFISLSEELIKILFDNKEYEETLDYAENLLRFENLNLAAYEYAIRSYENLDKHKQAREKYSRLLKSYESEYGEKLPQSFTSKLSEIM
jgi:DNA-binding SARP family transcriptional activator